MTGPKLGADHRARAGVLGGGGTPSPVDPRDASPAPQGDLFDPDLPVVDGLLNVPESVLLDDLIDSAYMLNRLGGSEGIGRDSVVQLRQEIILAVKALAARWTS